MKNMVAKEELVINIIHDKVNKEDIYFLGILKKLLTELDPYIFQHKHIYSRDKGFGIFILKKEENDLFKESELSHIFLNYYTDIDRKKLGRMLEYKLNDEYILFVYGLGGNINEIMKSNILTLQTVFKDETLKVFQPKLLDIFGLYGSFTILVTLVHYLDKSVFRLQDIFGKGSVKKNVGKYGKGDVTIDISILEKIIQEGKEKFKEKLDLLYLLLSNINKTFIKYPYFSLFFDFSEKGIEKFNINEKDIEKQELNCEFKTYTIKLHYLCSYIFREFFDDYVHGGSKKLITFYTREISNCLDRVYDGEITNERYRKFDLEYFKKVSLLID